MIRKCIVIGLNNKKTRIVTLNTYLYSIAMLNTWFFDNLFVAFIDQFLFSLSQNRILIKHCINLDLFSCQNDKGILCFMNIDLTAILIRNSNDIVLLIDYWFVSCKFHHIISAMVLLTIVHNIFHTHTRLFVYNWFISFIHLWLVYYVHWFYFHFEIVHYLDKATQAQRNSNITIFYSSFLLASIMYYVYFDCRFLFFWIIFFLESKRNEEW